MKFLAVVAALVAAPVTAEEVTQQELCTAVGSLAEQVMIFRQTDRPMSELMEKKGDNSTSALFEQMVVSAYARPAYSTPSNQAAAVLEYRNHWEYQCYTTTAN